MRLCGKLLEELVPAWIDAELRADIAEGKLTTEQLENPPIQDLRDRYLRKVPSLK